MNATPPASSAAAIVQGAAPARKGDSAAADTPFSRILSGEIAQQTPEDASEPRGRKELADILTELLDVPSDPTPAMADPSLAAQASSTESLLGMGLSFIPFAPAAQPVSSDKQTAETSLDTSEPADGLFADGARTTKTSAEPITLPASDAPAPDSESAAGRFAARLAADAARSTKTSAEPITPPASDTPTPDSELAGGLFAARLAADSGRMAEAPSELVASAALRPAAAPGAADTGPAPTLAAAPRLAPEVGNPAWNQALGEKIVWMASGKHQSASLTLNPPNLGPLQIVLNISSDQATANFFTAQPEVRQAIEAALPRLREMMGEAGIQLGQANVSADTPSQNPAPGQQAPRAVSQVGGGVEADEPALALPTPRMGRGLVDTFA
jgi:flagellar hook-length control protein FliK